MQVEKVLETLTAALNNPSEKPVLEKPENFDLVSRLVQKLNEFQATKQPFVLFFQPGAGANVDGIMDQWKAAGLAGCTGELCQIATLDYQYAVINSMTPLEQEQAVVKIQKAKDVNVKNLPIFNDPDQVLATLLSMEAKELAEVEGHRVYLPQAIVCNYNGLRLITEPVFNKPSEPNKPRSSDEYLEKVKTVLNATKSMAVAVSLTKAGIFVAPPTKREPVEEAGSSFKLD